MPDFWPSTLPTVITHEPVCATFGLLLTIFGCLARTPAATAYAVGLYITAAYWFTASTSFANPAVTLARALSDTFAGIAPSSVPPFIAMQLIGLGVGVALVLVLYPGAGEHADDIVAPHTNNTNSSHPRADTSHEAAHHRGQPPGPDR